MARKEALLKALLTLVLAGLLPACNTLTLGPKPNPVALSASPEAVAYADAGGAYTLTLTLQDTVKPVEVSLALADPCAKGTAYCPGWDASRYPGVTHPTGTYTLDSANPRVDLTFQVDATALPQGPFKYEIQVKDAEGDAWTVPFYLKIRDPRGRSAIEALADWRARAGLPGVKEDPEWGWRLWLQGRYAVYNYPNVPVHDEDPSHPFYTPEGREAARTSGLWTGAGPYVGLESVPLEETGVNGFITLPFHRIGFERPFPMTGSFGVYREVRSGALWSSGGFRVSYPEGSTTSEAIPFPTPGMKVPLNLMYGNEWPSPILTCNQPDMAPKRPYLTEAGLTWGTPEGAMPANSPRGFPITLSNVFPWKGAEVVEARVTRVADGRTNPVCAYGSMQYWHADQTQRDLGTFVLKASGTFVIIPHEPLEYGAEYEVYVKARSEEGVEKEWTWRFQVDEQSQMVPLRLPPSPLDGGMEYR
ncbi:CAP domain-containing protein [Thermus thalpophilus]|uniref:CAP domain-containing protein n=1 Tax=Thermus thalpophilus TaxID=2908147 RepID=UPI001FA96D21|nr:CAP domain-containing protein [Thermus thalpophilus]